MYYLQIILGAIILTAIAVPLSNNYKAIKAKNIGGGHFFQWTKPKELSKVLIDFINY